MTEKYNDMRIEVMNDEINRLRKFFFEYYREILVNEGKYTLEEVDRGNWYFAAYPSLNSYNRNHYDLLIECCDSARSYLK